MGQPVTRVMRRCLILAAGSVLLSLIPVGKTEIRADDYTSTNFILRNPVVTVEGGRSSSASFSYFSSSAQVVNGQQESTSFKTQLGFLYFPVAVTSPVVSATAGNTQVSLSWTAATPEFGYVIANYQVGTATVSGGPYTYSTVGAVLNSTRTGLTNSTPYYFIVRAVDNQGDVVATSTQVTATPVGSSSPAPGGGGGGGGGAGALPGGSVQTGVVFSGRAYPSSLVTLVKDAQVAATTVAGPDAKFEISLTGLSAGNFIFTLYSEDRQGLRSALLTFPVTLTTGATTRISGIFISPTIDVDKSEVKRGENVTIFGQTTPSAQIVIAVNSDEEHIVTTTSDGSGAYSRQFDTTPLELGQHHTKSKATVSVEVSSYGKAVGFTVGTKTVDTKPQVVCPAKADLNGDCRVNLVDFSIAAFWYKRVLSPEFLRLEKDELNGDAKVNLVDFSIMAFYWTG